MLTVACLRDDVDEEERVVAVRAKPLGPSGPASPFEYVEAPKPRSAAAEEE